MRHVAGAAAGLLMADELAYLGKALRSAGPGRSSACVGAAPRCPTSSRSSRPAGKVDALVIGAAMAYTFLKPQGLPVGKSLVEEDPLTRRAASWPRRRPRGIALELRTRPRGGGKLEAGVPTEVLAVTDPAHR